MMLYFMRHGKAEKKRPGIIDEDRRLTDEGRADVEYIARILPVRPSIIYSSPFRRARETAEIVAGVHGSELRIVEELAPGKASLEALKNLEITDNVLFVGHAPSIEEIVSELVGGGNIKLKAGAIAGIEVEVFEKGKGELVFLVTPQIARLILG